MRDARLATASKLMIQGRQHSRRVHQHPGHVAVGVHRDDLARPRIRNDGAMDRVWLAAPMTDATGPRMVTSGRDVVRPHVQQRSAAGLVVEVRVRMPPLVSRRDHRRRRRDGPADAAIVDCLAAQSGCPCPARCPGHTRPADRPQWPPSSTPRASAVVAASGFSPYTGLPASMAIRAISGMGGRDGQVEHEVHVRVAEQRLDAHGTGACRRGDRTRTLGPQVGDRRDGEYGSSRAAVARYWPEMAPQPIMPILSGWPTATPSR